MTPEYLLPVCSPTGNVSRAVLGSFLILKSKWPQWPQWPQYLCSYIKESFFSIHAERYDWLYLFYRYPVCFTTCFCDFHMIFSSRNARITPFSPLSRPTVVLRYRLLTICYHFSPISHQEKLESHMSSRSADPKVVLRYLFLTYSYDFLWISNQDFLETHLSSRTDGLRPCFATGFWPFPWNFYGFRIKIKMHPAPCTPELWRVFCYISNIR